MSKRWSKREDEVMRSLGLKPTRGSGAGWIEKEDGEGDNVIAQLKSTDGAGIKVDRQAVRDLLFHAKMSRKKPVFVLDFVGDGNDKSDVLLVACRVQDLKAVAKALGGKRGNRENRV